MNKKIESKLTGVPETMLIPLRARFLQTKQKNGIINDPKSVEILEQIEYDFSGNKEVSKSSQLGVAIRTEILDEQTTAFLKKHPDAVVVNFGCGLDTRFPRMDNGKLIWFDLDVPEAIELRKNFFTETDRFKFIAKSVLDFSWIEEIQKNKPTLFLAEGLFMYFTEEEVKSLFAVIGKHFPGAELLLETIAPFLAKRSDQHADVKKYDASFKWGIKTGKEFEKWGLGIKFINEYSFFDRYKNRWTFMFKILRLFKAFRQSSQIIHIKFSE